MADFPGLTRDRKYGYGRIGTQPFIVIDTGGLSGEAETIDELMAEQTHRALDEADHVIFMVDAREGLTASDSEIASQLRRRGVPLTLVANKVDGLDADVAIAEFGQLGLGVPVKISSTHGRGIDALVDDVLAVAPVEEGVTPDVDPHAIRLAVIGRPNVGKSTLINRLLGEERVVASATPGTTRDSIYVPFESHGQSFVLIDTAGVRRRARVKATVEKFSIVKALKAIDEANVVLLVLDAQEGITEQDRHLAGIAVERGRAMVIAVNKWDGLDDDQRRTVHRHIDLHMKFLSFAELHFVSALHGSGIGLLPRAARAAYEAATRDIPTADLNTVLERALEAHQPPVVGGRRSRLRYAHQGGRNPPVIVIHGARTRRLPADYRRYLINRFRAAFKLAGTPVRLEFQDR